MTTQPAFHLRLLGGASLNGPDGQPLAGRAGHRHRLALLALLARARDRSVSRDLLMALLWPESDPEQARNLLKVSVYVLRQALGEAALVSTGGALQLDTGLVDVDVLDFEAALARGDERHAVSLYGGPFLDGFFLRDAPEFGHWLDRERAVLADAQGHALEALAVAAEAGGDREGSVDWWKARAAHDPFDSRVALRLMHAMVAAGNVAGAIGHARIHSELLAGEIGIEPPPELEAYIARLVDGAGAEVSPLRAADPPRGSPGTPASARRDTAPALEPPDGEAPRVAPTSEVSRASARGGWGRTAVAAIGVAAVAALIVVASRDAGRSTAEASTTDVVAWELYQRASRPEMLRSDSAARVALDLFADAVELDPGFAAAHAGLARMLVRVGPAGAPDGSGAAWLERARRHASTATRLDPLLAEAYATLGMSEIMLFRFPEAEVHLDRAIALDPAFVRAREWKVALYLFTGRFDEALVASREALAADPLSSSTRAEVARVLLVLGRCDEALEEVLPLTGLRPPLLRAGPIAAQCHVQRGNWEEAVRLASLGGDASGARGRAWQGYVLARAGRIDEATRLLEELRDSWGATGTGAFFVALVLSGLDRPDEACEWLWRSVEDHSLSFELREPAFDAPRAHPRCEVLVQRLDGGDQPAGYRGP